MSEMLDKKKVIDFILREADRKDVSDVSWRIAYQNLAKTLSRNLSGAFSLNNTDKKQAWDDKDCMVRIRNLADGTRDIQQMIEDVDEKSEYVEEIILNMLKAGYLIIDINGTLRTWDGSEWALA